MPLTMQRETRAEILSLVFAAVADATRRSMLDRLREGSLTITELARPYPMSLNAVSKHVKTLERAGLIQREIRGREHTCRLNTARFQEAMDWMSCYAEFWKQRMDAFENHLAKKRKQAKP